ncbi:L-methionine/branched-chain amino acid transporter [Parashewanella spongiae]|uniref:L-methionine/branched-chain amino acid transporter n=1 Tax=Parashewanella spongiae TaxID=342950 RepID=A0A3A6TK98_9GAMM|nr:L-methionine/branched-chain amino acid transporter [Parashewanella spongiae]MCL1078977.1 L-methionine/branched-chain amino acid transporter [Parashewanella spongiae]RJY11332.1 L-methionine/branched-chain amino acid transporter [Parashewanella spongiae]
MNATIGRWQGAGLMATTLLGTGVFILPQITVEVAGFGALFAWAALTICIIPVTLVFGKLSSIFPHAAGPAYFVEKAFGRTMGRTIGLIFLLVVPLGAPAAILMTFQFVDALFSVSGWAKLGLELLVIVGLYFFGKQGLQVSAKVQFALTLTVISIVVLLFGSSTVNSEQFVSLSHHDDAQLSLILVASGIAFWSFLGVEAMTHLADDFKQPEKDMLPAMMIGVALVGIIYVACTLLLLLVPTDHSVAMIGIFDQLLGGYGAQVIGILGISSGLATVNVYSASAARLTRSFSQEQILPRYFDKVNERGVPERALTVILIVMAVVLFLSFVTEQQLEHLISWTNGVFVIIYMMAMLSAIKLLNCKYLPWIILGCGFCLGMAIALGANMTYAMLMTAAAAPVLWWQKHYLRKKQVSVEQQG